FSPDPYIFSLCNCTLWVLWALVTPDRTAPLQTNTIGTIIYVFYLVVYSTGSPGRTFFKKIGMSAAMLVVVGMIAFWVAPKIDIIREGRTSLEVSSMIFGFAADTFNVLMYAGPLTIMSTVVRTKSVEFMPLPLTLGTILCSSTWLGYGLVVGDSTIIIPNAGGTGLGLVQIVLYGCYANTEESKLARSKVEDLNMSFEHYRKSLQAGNLDDEKDRAPLI
ncbi:hypothetical protein TrRE_jg3645, partial [Triparma retinervis]